MHATVTQENNCVRLPRRETAYRQHGVAERDDRDPGGRKHQDRQLIRPHIGDGWRRQPGRDGADHTNPVVVQGHAGYQRNGRQHGDQCPR